MAAWKRDAIAQFLWDGRAQRHGSSAPRRAGAATPRDARRLLAVARSRRLSPRPARRGRRRLAGGGRLPALRRAGCRVPSADVGDRRSHAAASISIRRATASWRCILATHAFDAGAARSRRTASGGGSSQRGSANTASTPRTRASGRFPRRPAHRAGGRAGRRRSVGACAAGGSWRAMPAFLARVRAAEPDAFIVYRPHPDVVAGLRRGRVADPVAGRPGRSGRDRRLAAGARRARRCGPRAVLADRVRGAAARRAGDGPRPCPSTPAGG